MYPPDYHCNGLAIHHRHPVEQFYLNSIISCFLVFLFITPIFVKFQCAILEKTLHILQYFQHIRNICVAFKEYYHLYKQLQHLCEDSSSKQFQPKYVKLVQTEPPSEEYIVEVWQQIHRLIQILPPPEEEWELKYIWQPMIIFFNTPPESTPSHLHWSFVLTAPKKKLPKGKIDVKNLLTKTKTSSPTTLSPSQTELICHRDTTEISPNPLNQLNWY